MRPSDNGPRRFRLHRGRKHVPKIPPGPPCPLSEHQMTLLAAYNVQVHWEGLVHTERWDRECARLQERYDRWNREESERLGRPYRRWLPGIGYLPEGSNEPFHD